MAVAKTATADTLKEAWAAGQRLFGHNRIQALSDHQAQLPEAEWHLLGPLQGKKVRKALELGSCLQALGDLRTLGRIERVVAETERAPLPVLLQVNLNPEDGRYGISLEDLPSFVEAVSGSPGVRCQGLMTLALQQAEESKLRADFSRLHAHFQDLIGQGYFGDRPCLSMGMSADYRIAIEEGATLVRVGRAIFPPR